MIRQPRGRPPTGKYWNGDVGKWLPDPTIPVPKFKRPSGKPPPNKYWHSDYGVWMPVPGAQKKPRPQRGPARPFLQFCNTSRDAYRNLNRPGGKAFARLSFALQMKLLAKMWEHCTHPTETAPVTAPALTITCPGLQVTQQSMLITTACTDRPPGLCASSLR